MDDLMVHEVQQPEYYVVVPEFNENGRLCNYHTGKGETVRVKADEWERFNQLAGRQHEIIDGVVIYNPALEPCMPDDTAPIDETTARLAEIEDAIIELASIIVGGNT